MTQKRDRQDQILDLLSRNRIENQEQFVDLLLAEGVRVTQSTLSRDLRELGVRKADGAYRAPAQRSGGPDALRAIAAEFHGRVGRPGVGDNLLVLDCADSTTARALAVRFETERLTEAVKALVVESTVIVIAKTAPDARALSRAFRE